MAKTLSKIINVFVVRAVYFRLMIFCLATPDTAHLPKWQFISCEYALNLGIHN